VPSLDIDYSDDEKEYEWFVDKAVVTLYNLYGILVAIILGEPAGLSDCKIAKNLDAINCTVIHY